MRSIRPPSPVPGRAQGGVAHRTTQRRKRDRAQRVARCGERVRRFVDPICDDFNLILSLPVLATSDSLAEAPYGVPATRRV